MELFDYFVGLGANPLLLDCRGCNGLHYAARANNLGALKKILEGKPGVNIIDGFGWTPLHWAAASKSKSAQVIKALVDQGCNKDLKDKARRTALDLAAIFENTESVAILNDMDNECTDLSNNGASTAKEPTNYECDGCAIIPDVCGREKWYKCTTCDQFFDLCFRCIVDKDIIHASGHSWSDQISTTVKWSEPNSFATPRGERR